MAPTDPKNRKLPSFSESITTSCSGGSSSQSLHASFLWLALPNKILACGNVIRISSTKFFFSMKARDGKCCSKFCLIP